MDTYLLAGTDKLKSRWGGRTLTLYWHASNVHGPEWAIDHLESAACDWTTEEIDFVDWVFNAAPMLKERTAWMALNEELTCSWDAVGRAPYAQKAMALTGCGNTDRKKWGIAPQQRVVESEFHHLEI